MLVVVDELEVGKNKTYGPVLSLSIIQWGRNPISCICRYIEKVFQLLKGFQLYSKVNGIFLAIFNLVEVASHIAIRGPY